MLFFLSQVYRLYICTAGGINKTCFCFRFIRLLVTCISWISIPCMFRDGYILRSSWFSCSQNFFRQPGLFSFPVLPNFGRLLSFSFPWNLRSRYGGEGGTWGLGTEEKVEPWGLVTDKKVIVSFPFSVSRDILAQIPAHLHWLYNLKISGKVFTPAIFL